MDLIEEIKKYVTNEENSTVVMIGVFIGFVLLISLVTYMSSSSKAADEKAKQLLKEQALAKFKLAYVYLKQFMVGPLDDSMYDDAIIAFQNENTKDVETFVSNKRNSELLIDATKDYYKERFNEIPEYDMQPINDTEFAHNVYANCAHRHYVEHFATSGVMLSTQILKDTVLAITDFIKSRFSKSKPIDKKSNKSLKEHYSQQLDEIFDSMKDVHRAAVECEAEHFKPLISRKALRSGERGMISGITYTLSGGTEHFLPKNYKDKFNKYTRSIGEQIQKLPTYIFGQRKKEDFEMLFETFVNVNAIEHEPFGVFKTKKLASKVVSGVFKSSKSNNTSSEHASENRIQNSSIQEASVNDEPERQFESKIMTAEPAPLKLAQDTPPKIAKVSSDTMNKSLNDVYIKEYPTNEGFGIIKGKKIVNKIVSNAKKSPNYSNVSIRTATNELQSINANEEDLPETFVKLRQKPIRGPVVRSANGVVRNEPFLSMGPTNKIVYSRDRGVMISKEHFLSFKSIGKGISKTASKIAESKVINVMGNAAQDVIESKIAQDVIESKITQDAVGLAKEAIDSKLAQDAADLAVRAAKEAIDSKLAQEAADLAKQAIESKFAQDAADLAAKVAKDAIDGKLAEDAANLSAKVAKDAIDGKLAKDAADLAVKAAKEMEDTKAFQAAQKAAKDFADSKALKDAADFAAKVAKDLELAKLAKEAAEAAQKAAKDAAEATAKASKDAIDGKLFKDAKDSKDANDRKEAEEKQRALEIAEFATYLESIYGPLEQVLGIMLYYTRRTLSLPNMDDRKILVNKYIKIYNESTIDEFKNAYAAEFL